METGIHTSDHLIISFDNCPLDTPVLLVARKSDSQLHPVIHVLNSFRGENATKLYKMLIGE